MSKTLRQVIRELVEDELEEISGTAAAGGFYTPYAFSGDKSANLKKRKQTATQAGYTLSDKSGEDEDNTIFEGLNEITHAEVKTVSQIAKKFESKFGWSGKSPGVWVPPHEIQSSKNAIVAQLKKAGVTLGKPRKVGENLFIPVLSISRGKYENVNEAGDPYYPWRNDPDKTARQKIGEAISDVKKSLREMNKVVNRCSRLKSETGMASNQYWNRTNKDLMKIENAITKMAQKIRQMRV